MIVSDADNGGCRSRRQWQINFSRRWRQLVESWAKLPRKMEVVSGSFGLSKYLALSSWQFAIIDHRLI